MTPPPPAPAATDADRQSQILLAAQLLVAGSDTKVEPFAETELGFSKDPGGQMSLFAATAGNPRLSLSESLAKAGQGVRAANLDQVWQMECQLLPVVRAMEQAGIAVDRQRLTEFQKKHAGLATEEQARLDQGFGRRINLNSPQQLLEALKQAGCSADSTKEDDLKSSGHPLAARLVTWRKHQNLATDARNYLQAIGADGRIHATFNQIGAVTGRFACSQPNLQAVGRDPELRRCFVAAPGHQLVIADYSQIELRLAAVVAGEARMLEAFANGEDIHCLTAAMILSKSLAEVTKQDRQLAKAVNFGLLYGQQAAGLVNYARSNYGVALTLEEAGQLRDAFFEAYPGLLQWHRAAWGNARDKQVTEVRTLLGRRRWLPAMTKETEWARFSMLVNFPIQGLAGDGMKLAMIDLARSLPPQSSRLVLTVHDELLVETPASRAADVCRIVETAMSRAMEQLLPFRIKIPVEGKVVGDWAGK